MRLPTVAAAVFATSAAAVAQPSTGERLYGHCTSCHALEPGRNTPAGPTLSRIVGRPIATERGFNYSPAMRRFAVQNRRWTPALLDRFLADPEAIVPGTEMSFLGLRDQRSRQVLIRWLSRARRPTH